MELSREQVKLATYMYMFVFSVVFLVCWIVNLFPDYEITLIASLCMSALFGLAGPISVLIVSK